MVSIKTLDLDTKKSQSWRSRKSWQFQKVSLHDQDREISILFWHIRKVLIQTEKSVEAWHIWQISTVCLDLDRELVNVITFLYWDFSICRDFWTWSLKKVLKKSWLCWEILKILDKYLNKDKSWQKNLDFKNQKKKRKRKKKKSRPSRKSRHQKKVSLDTEDVLGLDLDWSRLSRPPGL